MPAPLAYYRALARDARGTFRLFDSLRAAPIRVPVTQLMGARDGCIGADMARGQERFFAGPIHAEVIEGVGHFMHVERPAQIAERVTRAAALD
jgi:pimeloyl-ACP methyl ester carboxylesterase